MKPRRVLVTRPEPGAACTAEKLSQAGFEPIVLPLTETVALPVAVNELFRQGTESLLEVPAASAVAVTSVSALRHAPDELIAAIAHLPCHAVGHRTAEAARAAGFVSVRQGPGDAERLAAPMAAELAGKTVAYLCGRVRFPGFEQGLAGAGIKVVPIPTYDTISPAHRSGMVKVLLGGLPLDTVLVYSARAAEVLATIVERPELAHLFDGARFLCLSARIAAALGPVGGENVLISREPNEEALFNLLQPQG